LAAGVVGRGHHRGVVMSSLTAGMGIFKKKVDPISARSQQLTARIAELESRIQHLNRQAEPEDPRRLRSTAYPPGAPPAARRANGASQAEPVFERVDQKQLKEVANPPATARRTKPALTAARSRMGSLRRPRE